MGGVIEDLRLALRQLRRAPGFAVTVVLTLAIGIGATTAIFTLVYDVMLRPLPFPQADRLVVMEEVVKEFRDIYPTLPANANNFTMWQRNSHSFEAMTALDENTVPMGVGEHPLQVKVLTATPGFFSVVSTLPSLGRAFTESEATEGRDHVVVLMHSTWRDQFQSDPHVVGRLVTLNGFPYTVIGVMPESFRFPAVQSLGQSVDHPIVALVPKAFPAEELQEAAGDYNYVVVGRMRPGVTLAQASDDINNLQRQISAGLTGASKATLSAVVRSFQEKLVGSNRRSLLILLGAVAGLLLVGCINIMNLLLARAMSRRQQMAVAAALGARRSQVIRMAMRETMLLAIAGCVLGVLLADLSLPLMQHSLPAVLQLRGALRLDWASAACAATLALAAALLAGSLPAWLATRTQPVEVLHSESRLASETRSTKRLRRMLVAVEVAVGVVLVLMTGLLTLSLSRMMHLDRGFETQHVISAEVDLPRNQYAKAEQRNAFYDRLMDRLRQLPGVDHAGLVSKLPLAGDQWLDMIRVNGDARPFLQLPVQHFRLIGPDYLETIRLPLVAGRTLTDNDRGKRVAIVSELTAKTMWPDRPAVGQTFLHGGEDAPLTVIGVAKDARTISLAKADPMMVYVPYWYKPRNESSLALSTRQDPAQMADAIRRAVWSVDPAVAVPQVRALGGIVADSVANRRFEMQLLGLFAVSALLLAGLGIYGVVTYSVAQREREIGLRIALGAQIATIYRLVLREGLAPVLVGAAAGIGIAQALARVFRSMLFEVSPYQPSMVAASVGALFAVGVTACLLPARRAARVEPMKALRME